MATKSTSNLSQTLALKLPGLKPAELKSIATAIGKVQGKGLKITLPANAAQLFNVDRLRFNANPAVVPVLWTIQWCAGGP